MAGPIHKYKKEELKIQASIFEWFNNNYCLDFHEPQCVIFSVPNDLAGGNKVAAMQAKAAGLLSGVSDLIIVIPKKTIFCELKTEIGTQSDEQIKFEKKVSNLGFEYWLIRSLNEFQIKIKKTL